MRGVEIRDSDAIGGLAFDLAEIVEALGNAVSVRTWMVQDLECVGDAAEALHEHADASSVIEGPALERLARNITQVIDGDVYGYLPGEREPSLVIRAVDATFWEVRTARFDLCRPSQACDERATMPAEYRRS